MMKIFLRGLEVFFGIFILLFCVIMVQVVWYFPDPPHAVLPKVEIQGEFKECGKSWLRQNQYGLYEVYLEGNALERGLAYGVLCSDLMQKQEQIFVEQISRLVPSPYYLHFLKYFVAWFNREIPEHISAEQFTEIGAVSLFFSDDFSFIGPKFYRILNYHAAHDVGHALADLRMVGCSSFAVKGEKTGDGELLLGRNFDFYLGEKFSRDKIVLMVKPDSGYGFISYTWAGMMGVLSGMNEKGLSVTINAASSGVPLKAKTPISLLVREILQYASSIEEAYVIAKSRDVFVSESIMIASKEDNNTAIIELGPGAIDIKFQNEDRLICTNHYQSDKLKDKKKNIQNINNSDSKYRMDRLEELIDQHSPINVNKVAEILRDQKGLGDTDLGLINPKAINQLIAHHSVIFKPHEKLVWMSTPPYNLGNFICYSMDSIFNGYIHPDNFILESNKVEKDPFLYTNLFSNAVKFRRWKEKIYWDGIFDKSVEYKPGWEEEFIDLNPNSYLTYLCLADYYWWQNEYKKAIVMYEKSLQYSVASKSEIENIKKSIEQCTQKMK